MGSLKQKARTYSESFSGAGPLADESARAKKAEKIRAVLEQENAFRSGRTRILDIGCSYGHILQCFSSLADHCIGIDFDQRAMAGAQGDISFVAADAEVLPFGDGTFDIVICNHVYEHTDNPNQLVAEIERVLSPNGVCYFAGPNKYDLVEPHYSLPLLSWLPRGLSDRYVRWTRRGTGYPERPYSLYNIKRLLSRFLIIDYTEAILCDPVRFHATDILPPGSFKQYAAKAVFRFLPVLFPGFVFVLRKKRI